MFYRKFLFILVSAFVWWTVLQILHAGLVIRFDGVSFALPAFVVGSLALAGLSRSKGVAWFDRVVSGFECSALFLVISITACVASYAMAAMSRGWVDPVLLAADRAMGLDWPSYWNFVASHPLLSRVLAWAYPLIGLLPWAIIAALVASGQQERVYRFLLAHLIALVVTDISLRYFPATSAIAHFFPAADLPHLPQSGIAPIRIVEGLRQGTVKVIEMTSTAGLIAIPSFHACAAVLYTWAAWGLRRGKVLFLILDMLMLLSTPIYGGHFFIDIVAGLAVAWMAIGAVHVLGSRAWARPASRRATGRVAYPGLS